MGDGRATRPRGGVDGLSGEFAAILGDLRARGGLSGQSLPRVEELAGRFEGFAGYGLGVGSLAEVGVDEARAFVEAAADSGPVSVSTMHLRRTILRLLFRSARELGLVEGDPTLDLVLPRRTQLQTRPLEAEEVALCRSAALNTLTSTRLSAAWALSEATARTAELACVTVGDLDCRAGRVWIHGTARTLPRWGQLTEWGTRQIARHLENLPSLQPDQRLVYQGAGSAGTQQHSLCAVINEVLTRAGLGTEPDVRPLSVVAWAGREILEATGRIDEVARRLGNRSLDRTARLIGFDWTDE